MLGEHSTPCSMHLCRYAIANADMYYAQLGLRDVTLRTDELGNFQILGETIGRNISTTVQLCEIFLEYAAYCRTWWELDEAFHQMEDFAEYIGHAAGRFLKRNTRLVQFDNPCERVLERLFQAISAHVSIEYSEGVEHFIVIDCPLEAAAKRSGLRNIELAHFGINIMCQSMIAAIDPEVMIRTTSEVYPEFDFTIFKPKFA